MLIAIVCMYVFFFFLVLLIFINYNIDNLAGESSTIWLVRVALRCSQAPTRPSGSSRPFKMSMNIL
jgi:hypothetical protein